MCEKKRGLVLMCGRVLFMREMCARIKHGRIFMTKQLEVFFQIVLPPKSTVGFVSNLKLFLFRKCRRFFPNFSIIGLAIRELHLPEVEGVVVEFKEGFP